MPSFEEKRKGGPKMERGLDRSKTGGEIFRAGGEIQYPSRSCQISGKLPSNKEWMGP